MTPPEVLAALDRLIAGSAPEELPGLVGRLVELEERARLRLRALPPFTGNGRPMEEPERLLTPELAADVIGGVSPRWVLRHTKGLRFRHDLSRKCVRFEESGLRRWMAAKRG